MSSLAGVAGIEKRSSIQRRNTGHERLCCCESLAAAAQKKACPHCARNALPGTMHTSRCGALPSTTPAEAQWWQQILSPAPNHSRAHSTVSRAAQNWENYTHSYTAHILKMFVERLARRCCRGALHLRRQGKKTSAYGTKGRNHRRGVPCAVRVEPRLVARALLDNRIVHVVPHWTTLERSGLRDKGHGVDVSGLDGVPQAYLIAEGFCRPSLPRINFNAP